jgi:hypothetical protein
LQVIVRRARGHRKAPVDELGPTGRPGVDGGSDRPMRTIRPIFSTDFVNIESAVISNLILNQRNLLDNQFRQGL